MEMDSKAKYSFPFLSMLFWQKSPDIKTFTILREEWTPEDEDDLKTLIAFPKFHALVKLVHQRIEKRTEELVNGKETRDRIDELSDFLLELKNYGNPV